MVAYVMIRSKVDPTMIVPPKEDVGENTSKVIHTPLSDVPYCRTYGCVNCGDIFTLYSGLATATESAAIGAVLAGVIVLLNVE